jgi:hypothetical protein
MEIVTSKDIIIEKLLWIDDQFQILIKILLEENHLVNLQHNKCDLDHMMFSIFVLEDLVEI